LLRLPLLEIPALRQSGEESFCLDFSCFVLFIKKKNEVGARGQSHYILYKSPVRPLNGKFDVYWHNEDLNDMFMDDEGVIIARELGGQQVHYRDTRQ